MSEIKVNKISPRSGTTVTLGDSGDTFTMPSGATINNQGTAVNFGATGSASWVTTVKTTGFTAVAGEGYFCNTSGGAFTVTLPASPSAGDVVAIKDYANTFDTENLTLGRNGSAIGGDSTTDGTLSIEGLAVTLVYVDATKGWLVTDSGLQSEAPTAAFVAACGGNTTITCGNFKIHVFTGPGTFTVSDAGNAGGSNSVDYLVVAGGASGGNGGSSDPADSAGGGGAGGMRYSKSTVPAGHPNASPTGAPVSVQAYSIVVGAGGAAQSSNNTVGNSGSVSTFSTITSAGGGGGGAASTQGANGGSGGGGAGGGQGTGYTGGTGNQPPVSPPQGNNGGVGAAGVPINPDRAGGGGGGAGAVGGAVTGGENTGQGIGGDGMYVPATWFGPTAPSYGQAPSPLAPNGRYFAGGGGGTSPQGIGSPYGKGGGAGGGGSYCNTAPGLSTPGATNTGGGGGGAAAAGTGFAGGSGFVAIRYKFQ